MTALRQLIDWAISDMTPEALTPAAITWQAVPSVHPILTNNRIATQLEKKASLIEEHLTIVYDSYIKQLRVTAHSKCWQTPEIKAARTVYSTDRRRLRKNLATMDDVRSSHNCYYYTIGHSKSQYWRQFIEENEVIVSPLAPTANSITWTEQRAKQRDVHERCLTALRYATPYMSSTTPALQDQDGNFIATIEGKEKVDESIRLSTTTSRPDTAPSNRLARGPYFPQG